MAMPCSLIPFQIFCRHQGIITMINVLHGMHHNADDQADLSKKETIRLTNNGRDGQLQNGLPDWLYEGDHDDHNYHDEDNDHDDDHDDYHGDDQDDEHFVNQFKFDFPFFVVAEVMKVIGEVGGHAVEIYDQEEIKTFGRPTHLSNGTTPAILYHFHLAHFHPTHFHSTHFHSAHFHSAHCSVEWDIRHCIS